MSYTLVPTELIVDGAITSAKLDTNIAISGTLGVTGEVTLATHLVMGDNDKIKIGTGGDLEIYHDGSNSYISNSTGNIYLGDTNGAVHIQAKLNEESIVASADGAVTLYHDNSAKLATASGGVTVTGTLTATTLAGTLSTAAQPNITSLGSLTALQGNGAPFVISNTNNGNNIDIKTTSGGSLVHSVKIHSGGVFEAKQGAVFNEDSNDVDFRVESNGNANMLFVDGGNDRVGINGTGTNARGGSNTVALFDISGSGKNYVEIQGATDSTANGLLFSDGSSGNYGVLGYNHANDNMNFFTAGSERMRIDSSGNVLIGTASLPFPNGTGLAVNSSGTISRLILQNSSTGTGTTDGMRIGAIGTNLEIENVENGNIEFYNNGSERMRIDSSGKVHINETVGRAQLNLSLGNVTGAGQFASSQLNLSNPTNVNAISQITFGYDAVGLTNAASYIGYLNGSSSSNGKGSLVFGTRDAVTDTQPTERMRINASGCIGLGSTADRSLGTNITTTVTSGSAGSGFWLSTGNSSATSSKIVSTVNGSVGELFIKQGSGVNGGSIIFHINDAEKFRINSNGNCTVAGALSKGSGSFKIDHPLKSKKDTHHLVHSFVEAPKADNIYRGKVALSSGSATVNIDTVAGMTEGTFVALNTDVQCFTSNETGWTATKGTVSGNILTITAQDNSCTETISWLVIGERHDQHMKDTDWTDENGKVIVEPSK